MGPLNSSGRHRRGSTADTIGHYDYGRAFHWRDSGKVDCSEDLDVGILLGMISLEEAGIGTFPFTQTLYGLHTTRLKEQRRKDGKANSFGGTY